LQHFIQLNQGGGNLSGIDGNREAVLSLFDIQPV
jgi:hypothetical protein